VGLTASGGTNHIVLSWAVDDPNLEGLPYFRYDHAEVWRSPDPSMADAVQISAESFTAFDDTPLDRGDTFYYQVRAIDKSNQAGPFSNVATASEISGDVQLDLTGYAKFPNGLIFQWGVAVTDGGGEATVTYPLVFPNEVLGLPTLTPMSNSFLLITMALETPSPTPSTDHFRARSAKPVAVGPLLVASAVGGIVFNWQAFGH
jgi:hypothetical protein